MESYKNTDKFKQENSSDPLERAPKRKLQKQERNEKAKRIFVQLKRIKIRAFLSALFVVVIVVVVLL